MTKVFVNGSFDVIHYGHLFLLNTAKNFGDFLLVAIDSDRRIKEKKGNKRPFNSEFERLIMLKNLKSVDEVKIFDTDEQLISIIKEYSPDYMFVGSDWKGKTIVGSNYAKKLIFFERIHDVSTTKKIESYIDR